MPTNWRIWRLVSPVARVFPSAANWCCSTRTVPACTQDAARVAAHEQPEVRSVTVGDRSVPYWDAGSPYVPDRRGYFPGGMDTTGLVGMAWAFDPGPPDEHRG